MSTWLDLTTTARSASNLEARLDQRLVNFRSPVYSPAGDGAIDDSAKFASALTAATGGTLLVPPGTYIVTNQTIPANTVVYVMQGATLKLKAASVTHGLIFSNAGSSLIGPGAVDGNRANQSSSVMPVFVNAANATIDSISVSASKYHGIHAQNCPGLRVGNIRVSDVAQNGVNVDCSGIVADDIWVDHVRVDRSGENPLTMVGEAGVYLFSDVTGSITNGKVTNCHVIIPPSPTFASCGVVFSRVFGGVASGNTVTGGQIAVSIDSSSGIAVGNNSVTGFSNIGIEFALSTDSNASGNNIDGSGVGQYGYSVTFTAPYRVTITGGSVKGCTANSIRGTNANYLIVDAVNVTHTAATAAVFFTSMQHWELGGIFNGGGTGNRGLVLSTADRGRVNAEFYNFATDAVLITAATAVTLDRISFTGCHFESCGTNPITTSLSGGAVLGDQITVVGGSGYHATYFVEVANFRMNVLRATGAGTPDSNLTAGIGSTFQRNDGSTTTSLYVKTSGTGNTGWTGK